MVNDVPTVVWVLWVGLYATIGLNALKESVWKK